MAELIAQVQVHTRQSWQYVWMDYWNLFSISVRDYYREWGASRGHILGNNAFIKLTAANVAWNGMNRYIVVYVSMWQYELVESYDMILPLINNVTVHCTCYINI